MGGRTHFIGDDEFENIIKIIDQAKFLQLRNKVMINTSSITEIGEVEKIPCWSVYPVQETKEGKYIIREGEKCFLDPENIKQITYELPAEIKNHPDVLQIFQREQPVLPEGLPVRRSLPGERGSP